MFFRRSKKKSPSNRKSLHIRTGDQVLVISGEGREVNTPRKVLAVLTRERKVIVEGVNVMKDRQKQQRAGTRASGINQQDFVEKPFPIDVSKVALVDPKSRKRTRVQTRLGPDGTRTRVAARSGESI